MRLRYVGFLFLAAVFARGGTVLPLFNDATKQAGISFNHCLGAKKISNIVEATGSGCGWLDYDLDGHLDLYLVNGCYLEGVSDPNSPFKGKRMMSHLYRSNGDGTFSDVTERAGVGNENHYGMGVLVGDYDNDGRPDIYVTNYDRNVLYHNNGDGTFTDVMEKA